MIKNLKNSGELDNDTMENFKHKQKLELDEVEQDVYIDHKVNDIIVDEMNKKYGKDAEIKKYFDLLQEIEK